MRRRPGEGSQPHESRQGRRCDKRPLIKRPINPPESRVRRSLSRPDSFAGDERHAAFASDDDDDDDRATPKSGDNGPETIKSFARLPLTPSVKVGIAAAAAAKPIIAF